MATLPNKMIVDVVEEKSDPVCWVCDDNGEIDGRPCHICRTSEYKAWKLEQRNLAEFGRHFADKNLSNFKPRDDSSAKALEEINNYLNDLEENIKTGRGLTIIGPVGTGKTHLAVGIKKAAEKRDVTFAMVNCLNLIIECKQAIKKAESEYAVLNRYGEFPNLILDDFGINKTSSDWVPECWYYLINTRYVIQRTSIVTSNQRFSEIEEGFGYYGQRIVSRIKEMNGRAIAITAPDYRGSNQETKRGE